MVGCPSIDIVAEVSRQPFNASDVDSSDLGGVGANFSLASDFGMIMFHPDTLNHNENVEWARQLINLTQSSRFNWIWFWPNPDHGSHEISHEIRKARELGSLSNIRFIVNLTPEDFVKLALWAKTLIGNSSFGIREASFIGLPVVNIGKRQSGRQKAANVLDVANIISFDNLQIIVDQHIKNGRFDRSTLYGAGDSGRQASTAILNWVPAIKIR